MEQSLKLKPIHPFPARMAPSIVWEELARAKRPIRVLDSMAGSGTTLVAARSLGHSAIGFDTDPLAILIATAWCAPVDGERLERKAQDVVERARRRFRDVAQSEAYPARADEETRSFVRYWFDVRNRRQLAALASSIHRVREYELRLLLWCAFSRLIISKQAGASLAMDVSHSRPHRVYEEAPIRPFEHLPTAIRVISRNAPFRTDGELPAARVEQGDARHLNLENNSVDLVITSPPYLNAIDYIRGHKLSLVWMGYSLSRLRRIRSGNIGAEVCGPDNREPFVELATARMGEISMLPNRVHGMLAHYVVNMDLVLREISRVLIRRGRAVLVVGDSTLRGVFIENSSAIAYLGERNGLRLESIRRRSLPDSLRYLPPPSHRRSGDQLGCRMREEVILTFHNR